MIGEELHLLDCATVTDPSILQPQNLFTQYENISSSEPLKNYKYEGRRTEGCPTSLLPLITQEKITILLILPAP